MHDSDATQEFEAQRSMCFALAYRMTGSRTEAEDIVQEAWLRWRKATHPSVADAQRPRSAGAWLHTTVTRLCLDHLKSARVQREQYVGPWLPEPVATEGSDAVDPESISIAFLLLLERLSPAERAAYLLHKVFDVDYPQVATALEKSEAAVRQLCHRAQEHLNAGKPRFAPSSDAHSRLLTGFLGAIYSGDLSKVEALLAEDAKCISDGGGKVRAARNVVLGRRNVAKLFLGLAKKNAGLALRPELRELNGWPAIVVWQNDKVASALMIECDGAEIITLHVLTEPDKLAGLAARPLPKVRDEVPGTNT